MRSSLQIAVYCESASRTFNPIKVLGQLLREELGQECLFDVDAVDCLVGTPVEVD